MCETGDSGRGIDKQSLHLWLMALARPMSVVGVFKLAIAL